MSDLLYDIATALPILQAKKLARERYKIRRYFHDCLPGCKRDSLKFTDHVPLPGNEAPTCRVLYVQALQFFAAGKLHKERLFLAANRIGKTDAAAFEVRCHLTGQYPRWWPGATFSEPGEWWAAGDTQQTTRDIIQTALLGDPEGVKLEQWTGMLEAHLILDHAKRGGSVANCVESIVVKHVPTGGKSTLQFKSYDQGRRSFQGTKKQGVWLDEEPPDGAEKAEADAQGSSEIYTECLLRTMTTGGMLISTFTPLRGLTPFLIQYLENAVMPGTDGADVSAKANFYPDLLGAATVERAAEMSE